MIKRFLKRVTRLSALGAAIGALVYFLDPRSGRGRRARTKDQLQAKLRGTAEQADPTASHLQNKYEGASHVTSAQGGEPPEDDKTLVDKIKSEVLGRTEFESQDVVIDAVDGVVTLRGQVERPEQADDLAEAVGTVPGVRQVVNHLHPPGAPAPNKQDSLED